jgi:Icc-related predicted phosphoesterase
MGVCFFASDLHGRAARYEALWSAVEQELPAAVFLGGDLFAHVLDAAPATGVSELAAGFGRIRARVGAGYPRVFLILGNDDARSLEAEVESHAATGLWEYLHQRRTAFGGFSVYGYNCVPPTPFLLKDWERYDVSRYVDPGCVSPEEGVRSVPADGSEVRWGTIERDLAALVGDAGLERSVLLLHAPPYGTGLDRAALDGRTVEHAPIDVHVGSIAIRRLVEERQPLLTLHGHVHESARLTGSWRDRLGRTHLFSAAHDGPELALVRFDLLRLDEATRELA